MLLFLLAMAEAGELCRWPKADKPVTTAEGDEVTVNGMVFDVKSKDGHDRFVAVLKLCGAGSAVDEFEAWREERAALSRAQVGVAIGGFAAAAGLEDVRKRERAAALRLRNDLWFVLTADDEEEAPIVAPKAAPKPTDPDLPPKELFEIEEDEL